MSVLFSDVSFLLFQFASSYFVCTVFCPASFADLPVVVMGVMVRVDGGDGDDGVLVVMVLTVIMMIVMVS